MSTMHSYVLYNRLLSAPAGLTSNSDNKPVGRMSGARPTASKIKHSTDYPDAPLLNAALVRRLRNTSTRDGRFQSIDRGLKIFLRSSNLSGLEYRLKMAGYNTVNDLLEANNESLCAKGFTPLMARRLLSALEIYIQRQLDKTEGVQSPFQMVRRNQRIKSDPSETVKALPTFGKRNIKRKKASAKESQFSKAPPTTPRLSYIRLMSEESIPSEPIFPNVIDTRGRVPVEVGVANNVESIESVGVAQSSDVTVLPEGVAQSSDVTKTSSVGVTTFDDVTTQMPSLMGVAQHSNDVIQEQTVGVARESTNVSRRWTMFEEHTLDDIDAAASSSAVFNEFSYLSQKLERSQSVPADYWYDSSPPPYPWYRVRAYSCPPSLSSVTTPLERLVTSLSLSPDVGGVYPPLCELLRQLRVSPSDSTTRRVLKYGGAEVIVDVLQSMYAYDNVVEKCCRVVKYLARSAPLPPETSPALLHAMDCHCTSEKIQTHGSLALGNIIRTDPSQCSELVFTGALSTLSIAMETFPTSVQLQVSALAALAVLLSTHKDQRLLFISDHGHVLDLVLMVMENFPNNAHLQQYACSFLAMLTAEVGAQIEASVVQLILEHAFVAMTTHPHDCHVTIWSVKVISNSATNVALSGLKLALRCSELLVEVLATSSQSSDIQSWCSYGLLQLASQHKQVKDMLQQRLQPDTSRGYLSPAEDGSYQAQLREMLSQKEKP